MKSRVRWRSGCVWMVAALSVLSGCGGGGSGGVSDSGGVVGSASISQSEVIAQQPDQAERKEPEHTKPKCTIVLSGDSIMHGSYNLIERLEEPPAVTLKRLRPDFEILDWSVNGDSIAARSRMIDPTFPEDSIVVYEQGINDTAIPDSFEIRLRELVERTKAQGARVLLTGLTRQVVPVHRRDEYDEIIRKVASDTNSTFADWGSVELRDGDLADGLHPTKAYSDRLVERLVVALDEIAPNCRSQVADD